MTTETEEREIRSVEDRRYRALLDGDTSTLEQLLGDGLVYTHSTGTTDSKMAYLDGINAKRVSYRNIERPQEDIQVYGDTAVVSGRARVDVLVNDVPRVANLRYLSVLVKGAKGWQMVAFQATPISG